MTTEPYRIGATLAEVFLQLTQNDGMSPAAAAEHMGVRNRALHFLVEEEMTSCRFLAGEDGGLVVKTLDGLGRVDPSGVHVRAREMSDPAPLPLATQAALDAKRKKAVTADGADLQLAEEAAARLGPEAESSPAVDANLFR